ncbi:MAG: hypothetical protein COA44_09970 [Arcobacter sp.]|nr:MAG: hypothetical protein COA44_09970 [Arcobacter sp.]
MTRGVYSTKISDEFKTNAELSKDRLDMYAEVKRIIYVISKKQYTDDDSDKLHMIATKAVYLFNDSDINKYLENVITKANKRKDTSGHMDYSSKPLNPFTSRVLQSFAYKTLEKLFAKHLKLL